MSRKNPKADKARQLYLQGMKLVDIAAMLDVPDSTVRRWKSTHKWAEPERSGKAERSGRKTSMKQEKKTEAAKAAKELLENGELDDRDRLFCLYYTKSFNATKAYLKSHPNVTYESAGVMGCRIMKRPEIREEIYRLKQAKLNKAMLEPEDIFSKYMDIAFSDITDYVSFGRREVDVMGPFGPVTMTDAETGEKVTLKREVNAVEFRESSVIDGTLINEVSQGKDGAKIKLADRMRALDWLANHMDMGTPEQQARVEKLRAETERIKGGEQEPTEDKVRKLFEAIGGELDVQSE